MVKQGYKQTEIGLIPNDWNIVSIEKLATDMSDGPFGSNLKKEHYTDDKQARIIQLSNIGENGWLDTNVKYTTFSHAKTISRCIVNPGHIIVAKMMPAGRAIICPRMEKMYVLGSDSIKLELNATLVNTKYFMYSTKSSFFQTQIKEETQGSTRARTSISKLRKNKVLLPSIEEQKRIAEALSDVDSMISSLEKLIAKKKAVKQGAMQELLTGKKRLPGFAGEWVRKSFGSLCTICRGGSPRPIQDFLTTSDSGINWIKIGDVEPNAKYITYTQEKIIESGVSMSRRVYKGDFILSNSMSFGRPYILKIDGCIHDGWLAIQEYQKTFDTDYLYYLLGSAYVFEQYIQMAAGSSVQNLNKDKVAKLDVLVPPIEEQSAIASILSDMDNEIEALEQKLEKTRQIKQSMMQQLLTGKIRLV